MAFRNDHEASLARADALERELLEAKEQLAASGEENEELKETLALLERERDALRRERGRAEGTPTRSSKRTPAWDPRVNVGPLIVLGLVAVFLAAFVLYLHFAGEL